MSMVIRGINNRDSLYFVEVDFALLIIKTSKIADGLYSNYYISPFTIFMGTQTKLVANGLTLYESFTVG